MPVENTKFIGGLDPSLPSGTEPKAQGDDHLRLIKNALKQCFGGFAGEVLIVATEAQGPTVNDYVLTVSPALTAYAANTVFAFRATHANTDAATLGVGGLGQRPLLSADGLPLRPNAISADCWVVAIYGGINFRVLGGGNSEAVYDAIAQAQFASALPGQASQAGRFLATDGTNANWKAALPVYSTPPASNEGPIYRVGYGLMEWQGNGYVGVVTKAAIGLGNVDNTSDFNKPISAATQTALHAKANLTGAAFTGTISAPQVIATEHVYAASGAAYMDGSANLFGTAWGGFLSNWLSSQFATVQGAVNNRVPVRPGFGGHGYVINNSGSSLSMNFSGGAVQLGVDGTSLGSVWTTSNFDPSTKQPAGNYVRDYDATPRVGFSWDGSRLVLWVDGVGRGTIQFMPY